MSSNSKDRVCGGCTACCKTHAVWDIAKPEREWCRHCDIGRGCLIYDTRPNQCVDFACQWLIGFGEDSDRPDKSKVVLDYHELDGIGKILFVCESSKGGIERATSKDATHTAFDRGIPVAHVYMSGRKVLYLPQDFIVDQTEIESYRAGGMEIYPESHWYACLKDM